eukprot:3931796-Rhodomonas_salina.1
MAVRGKRVLGTEKACGRVVSPCGGAARCIWGLRLHSETVCIWGLRLHSESVCVHRSSRDPPCRGLRERVGD